MRLRGIKIEGVTYLVSEKAIQEHGSVEAACQAMHDKKNPTPKPEKVVKSKVVKETPPEEKTVNE